MDEWIDLLMKNMNKIESFFNYKYEDLQKRLLKLKKNLEKKNKDYVEKLISLPSSEESLLHPNKNPSNSSIKSQKSILTMPYKSISDNSIRESSTFKYSSLTDKAQNVKDELGYAGSWMRATSIIYVYACWLQGFSNINEVALRILNKKIKMILPQKIELTKKIGKKIEELSIFRNKKILEDFKEQIKVFYAEQFKNGDLKLTETEFDERLNGASQAYDKFTFYLCIGIITSLLAFIILIQFIHSGNYIIFNIKRS